MPFFLKKMYNNFDDKIVGNNKTRLIRRIMMSINILKIRLRIVFIED